MSETKQMRGIQFPGLEGVYDIPQIDTTLRQPGYAADAGVVGQRLGMMSEGISVNYRFNTPGWKRIMTTMRIHNGQLNLSLSRNDNRLGRIFQNLGIQYGAYVKHPHEGWDNVAVAEGNYGTIEGEHPVLYQLYNNMFGEDVIANPTRRSAITRVRYGYPKPGTTLNNGLSVINPINAYIDIYVDFDECDYQSLGREDSGVQFLMQFTGKTYNFGCDPILDETDASNYGLFNEELEFYEIDLKPHYALNITDRSNYIRDLTTRNLGKEIVQYSRANEYSSSVSADNAVEVKAKINTSGIHRLAAHRKYNLMHLPERWVPGFSRTVNGLTVTMTQDGGFQFSGVGNKAGLAYILSDGASEIDRYVCLPAGTYRIHGCQFSYVGYDENGNIDTGATPLRVYGTGCMVSANLIKDRITHTTGPILLNRIGFYITSGRDYNGEATVYPYICKMDGREADVSSEGGFHIKGSKVTDYKEVYSTCPTRLNSSNTSGDLSLDLITGEGSLGSTSVSIGNYYNDIYHGGLNPVDSIAVFTENSGVLPDTHVGEYREDEVSTKSQVPQVFYGDGSDINDSLGKVGDIYVVI